MSNRVLSIVPARKGSKGIPRKNMRSLGDRPLVAHAIETSKKSSYVDEVALTTDSQEISNLGGKFGVDSVVNRPESLATDDVPLAPVVEHAIREVEETFDYVLCFQPTVPLVTSESIDEGIKAGIDNGADSVIYVRDSTHQYWKSSESGYEPVPDERKNRQQMQQIYEEIGLFLTATELAKSGTRVSDEPNFHEVSSWEGIDIDTYGDWLLAESYLERETVIYRLIGSNDTGSGHVYRGISIADNLFNHDLMFAVHEDEHLAIEMLEESNYNYFIIDSDDAFLERVKNINPAVVVNDILNTSAEYISELSSIGPRVVNFEDLGNGTQHADAVVNALYEYSDPPENHYFGYKYFCLRNEFRYVTPHQSIPNVDTIMISFGGTDENDLTGKTLRALSTLQYDVSLDVVLGLGYSRQDELTSILGNLPPNLDVTVNQNINSMAEHMAHADLLITSNGRTLYEASSLNTPMISIAQNSREQRHPYAHVSRGVLNLGQANYISEDAIKGAVVDYIEEPERRETMRSALSSHDIGNGIERIKQILFDEINEN